MEGLATIEEIDFEITENLRVMKQQLGIESKQPCRRGVRLHTLTKHCRPIFPTSIRYRRCKNKTAARRAYRQSVHNQLERRYWRLALGTFPNTRKTVRSVQAGSWKGRRYCRNALPASLDGGLLPGRVSACEAEWQKGHESRPVYGGSRCSSVGRLKRTDETSWSQMWVTKRIALENSRQPCMFTGKRKKKN